MSEARRYFYVAIYDKFVDAPDDGRNGASANTEKYGVNDPHQGVCIESLLAGIAEVTKPNGADGKEGEVNTIYEPVDILTCRVHADKREDHPYHQRDDCLNNRDLHAKRLLVKFPTEVFVVEEQYSGLRKGCHDVPCT